MYFLPTRSVGASMEASTLSTSRPGINVSRISREYILNNPYILQAILCAIIDPWSLLSQRLYRFWMRYCYRAAKYELCAGDLFSFIMSNWSFFTEIAMRPKEQLYKKLPQNIFTTLSISSDVLSPLSLFTMLDMKRPELKHIKYTKRRVSIQVRDRG